MNFDYSLLNEMFQSDELILLQNQIPGLTRD
jgi:hypothetical protein